MEPGTLVWITAKGPMGTLESPESSRFTDDVLDQGDPAYYVGPHPNPELANWHLLRADFSEGLRYCPLPFGAFSETK